MRPPGSFNLPALGGRGLLLVAAVAMSALAAAGSFSLTWSNRTAFHAAAEHLTTISDLSSELRVAFGDIAADIGPLMISGDQALLDRVVANNRRFDAALDGLGAAIADHPDEAALFAVLVQSRATTKSLEPQFFGALRDGDLQGAMRLAQRPEYMQAGMSFGPAFEEMLRVASARSRAAYASAAEAERGALAILAGAFLVVIGLWTAIAVDWFRQAQAARALNANLERLVDDRTRQLEGALVRAEEAYTAKTEFLATMSHELRTPLNGVIGMASMLETSGLSAKQQSMVDVVSRSGRALLVLVNDILDYVCLETESGERSSEAFDVSLTLASAVAGHAPIAKAKALSLTLEVEDSARGLRVGEKDRVRRVIGLLVSNAVKFTDAGSIAVRGSETPEGLAVTVTDTGCGIPEDRLASIFEPFTQADASLKRRHDGAGLGLALAKKMVASMGGTLGVQSVVGEGSTFSFILPLQRVVEQRRAA